ncbi:hypothetical protein IGI71_003310 [Enterococcus sp. DIV1279b]
MYKYYFKFSLLLLKTLIAGVVANIVWDRDCSKIQYHSIKHSGHFPFLEGVF